MGWINDFEWSQEHSSESNDIVRGKVNSFEDTVFYLFAQSVLSGEYLIKQNYTQTLDSLFELLYNGEIYDGEEDKFKTIAIQFFNSMTYELCGIIRDFRHLLTTLNNKYEYRQTKYVVNAYKIRKDYTTSTSLGRLYNILINITRIDHFLSNDKRTISDLIIYHTELTKAIESKKLSEKNDLALRIINEKCLFLLKKLLIDDNQVFDFMIDFEHKQYDTRKIPLIYFSEIDKRFEFYRSDVYQNEPFGDDLDMKAHNKLLPFGEFTLLMKYYLDSPKTRRTQIENILKDFDKSYETLSILLTKRPIDRYALGTLKNFMYNCHFSFLMRESSYTFKQLKEGLDEIIDIQEQTGIFNYYPYRKAFEKALELFKYNEHLEKSELDDYKSFLQLCISKFSEAIKWCKTNYFYPIQNTYRECLVRVADFGVVFIASTFSRPVRYEILKDELNTFKSKALFIENEISLREEKRELNNIKKEINNSKSKEVEILSVFTAIITFLFGTIGFFAENKNNDFLHLFFSICGLGAILMIFVSGIHIITMKKEEKVCSYFMHPRMWFCVITIILCVVMLIWLLYKVSHLPSI